MACWPANVRTHRSLAQCRRWGQARASLELTATASGRSCLVTTFLLYLLYLSTEFLWWQAVVGIIGGLSSNALRMNAQCTWRRRTGLPNVYNTAIRRALSPLRLCG